MSRFTVLPATECPACFSTGEVISTTQNETDHTIKELRMKCSNCETEWNTMDFSARTNLMKTGGKINE